MRLASLMAENEDFMFEAIAGYIETSLGYPVDIVDSVPWQARERILEKGEIDVAWICGLPYVRKVDSGVAGIELLAAPVVRGERYGEKPVYFSDVVVHRRSRYIAFQELKGASWAYNEPGSHSGYGVVKYFLAREGLKNQFFGRVIETDSHQNSLGKLVRREVDVSVIDSIVLENEFERNPDLRDQLRIIETIGPSPVPPLVVSTCLPMEIRVDLRDGLTCMHMTSKGRDALATGRLERLVAVSDRDYNPIRQMAMEGKDVIL